MHDSPGWTLQADEALLRRFLSGDPAACRKLENWAREILSYQRLGLTREEREDVTQDVMGNVWQATGRPGFQLRHGLHAFVRTVTLARAIDLVRRRRRVEVIDDRFRDSAPGPAEQAEKSDDVLRLYGALEALDTRCREIIRLHYFEGWSYAQIAQQERRRESTMRVRMFNCLKGLRGRMDPGAAAVAQ